MSKSSIPFRPIYHQLDNGLKTVVIRKPGLHHGFALLATRFGSLDRQLLLPGGQVMQLPAGVAHFLEHQLFEQEHGNVSDRFAALGAQDNAFTHFGQTGYFFMTSNHFWEAFDLLLSFTLRPYFEAQNVEQEKGIITQELRMYEDDPNAQADLSVRRLLFGEHPAGEDIGGTVESIREITPDLLYQCHQAFYRPDNMVLVVIGDLEPDQVLARTAQMTARNGNQPAAGRLEVPEARESVVKHAHRRSMHVSRPICLLGMKDRDVGLSGADLLRRQVEMDILLDVLFGKSSPFYWQLYSKNLISDDFFSDYLALPSFAYACVGGESVDPDRLVDAIQTEIKLTAERGISPEVVERLKRKTLGEFVSSFNSSDGLAFALSSSMLTDACYEELPAILEQVSAESLHERLLQQFHPDNSAVAVIEPR